MEKTPDQYAREAETRDPAKYNPRNPWPRVDQYVKQRTPVDLQPGEDYSEVKASRLVKYQQIDATDTIRELRAKQIRISGDKEEYVAASSDPLNPEFYNPNGTPENEYFTTEYMEKALALEQREIERTLRRDISGYESTKDIIARAKEAGIELSADDIENIVDWAVLNSAADKVIALYKAGDVIGTRNVALTLSSNSPEMGALLPDLVQEKIIESIEDPNLMERFSAGVMGVIEKAMVPFVAANEWVMEGVRAGFKEVYDESAEGRRTFGPLEFAQGFLSAETRSEVRKGDFNQEYISAIRGSGEYSDIEVDIALEVSRRKALGDPDAIISVYTDKYFGNQEAGRIVRDIMYNRGDPRVQDLLRQIDSAHLGNTGQIFFGAADYDVEFDPARASALRQDLANVAGFAGSVLFDPTIFGSKAFRLLQGTKFALAQLAPSALKGRSASSVIKKTRIAGMEFSNPVYRFFDNLTNDLNRLDDLTTRAASATDEATKANLQSQAASLRQRMSRQYADMPDDLIDDFYTTLPRNADGVFDVDSVIKYIDETNDAYITELGQVTDDVIAQGATVDQIPLLAEKILNEKDLYSRTFVGRVSATNMRRDALVPRMSLVGALRRKAVNRIIARSMPQKKAVKLISDFVDDMSSPESIAAGLSGSAEDIGKATRAYKFRSGLLDSTGRLFSSIAVKRYVSITSGSDAKSIYRYARMFLPKRSAELVADAFRRGTPGSRRLLVSGLIRTAAVSRGIPMTQDEAALWARQLLPGARDLGTGTRAGERYALQVFDEQLPSKRLFGDVEEITDETVPRSLSADRNGIEHALHLDQTSDNVALPSIREFEALRDEINFGRVPVGKYRNYVGTGFQKATDYWSIGTLFGFRFSIRNAIEETGLYWLTGGSLLQFLKGRQQSQALRNARPRVYVKMVTDKKTGKRAPAYKGEEPELIYRSSLGMFANKREWLKRQFANSKTGKKVDDYFEEWSRHNGYRHWLADLILPAVNRRDSAIALKELAQGDPEAFQKLATKALAAQKTGKLLLNEDDNLAFSFLAGSSHGIALVDEIAEASRYLNDGGFPGFVASTAGTLDEIPPGVGVSKMGSSPYSLGAYSNVRPVQVDRDLNEVVWGVSFWWRELQRTVDGDGIIGEVAIRRIRDISRGQSSVADAKVAIAQAIRDDETYGYVDRLSRIQDDASIDEFADSYFENVLAHVQRADGSINDDLVERFFENDEYVGWWKKTVGDDGVEAATPRVSSSYLKGLDKEARPQKVFGRKVNESPYIPFAETLPALFSVGRAYGWMGAQNARISREPIFIANYLDQFGKTKQMRQDLAEAIAKSRGASMADDSLDEATKKTIQYLADSVHARQSMDNAYNISISFMDNPANRSNLAWKSRNVSRYYRASEDFYRRLKRTALVRPEGYWKGALIYHLLDDTGFVFTDDNGEKYFAYPGNEILQETTASILSRFYGVNMTDFKDVDPFIIGGKVLGGAPSTDPNQFFPSVSGPVMAAGLGAFFQKFPTLGGLRSALMGPYSQPAENTFQEVLDAFLPAGFNRAIRLLDPEQRDAQIVQAGVDTIALMAAEGLLDEVTVVTSEGVKKTYAGTAVDPEMFKQTEEYKASQTIAGAYFMTKSIMSWFVAAYPQEYSNTATDFARGAGIDSAEDAYRDISDVLRNNVSNIEFDPEFVKLLVENEGEVDPWAAATSAWFGMKASEVIDGPYASMSTMMPFTLSSYKPAGSAVAQIANVQISEQLVDWLQSDTAKDLKAAGFGDARYFLAPREGDFSWPAWTFSKNVLKIRVKKSEDEQIEEILALNGQAMHNQIRREYESDMRAVANNPDRLSSLVQERDFELKNNRAVNPAWDAVKGTATGVYTQANYRRVFSQTRGMLEYLKERDGELSEDAQAIENSINVYLDYSSQKNSVIGQTKEAKFERNRLDGLMQQEWQVIKSNNAQAAFFIDAVLEGLSFDPTYVNAFGDS